MYAVGSYNARSGISIPDVTGPQRDISRRTQKKKSSRTTGPYPVAEISTRPLFVFMGNADGVLATDTQAH